MDPLGGIAMKPELRHSITAMFEHIDACQWDVLPHFFHEDVRYIRPGYDPISGLPNLLDFYKRRRIIKSGRHVIELICAAENGDTVSAIGAFRGKDWSGKDLDVRFCDVYEFEGQKIVRRETFFNAPAV